MKKIRILIILLIIINSIILVGFIISHKRNQALSGNDNSITSIPGEQASFELNEKIYPENYIEFQRYIKNTKIDSNEIYKSLYKIIKENKKYSNYSTVKFLTETFGKTKDVVCVIEIINNNENSTKLNLKMVNYKTGEIELTPLIEE